jgi:hypothetical protein
MTLTAHHLSLGLPRLVFESRPLPFNPTEFADSRQPHGLIAHSRRRGPCNPDSSPRSDTFRGLPEGRGFSPAEIAAPTPCLSRAPRSLRPQAARGSEQENHPEGLVTAGLKPRPALPFPW